MVNIDWKIDYVKIMFLYTKILGLKSKMILKCLPFVRGVTLVNSGGSVAHNVRL